jgi:hypothetical protein
MAREISRRGASGVTAYAILSDEEIRDRQTAKAKIESRGFSGVVVMNVVGRDTEYTWEPETPVYRQIWGTDGPIWVRMWKPARLRGDSIVSVETRVYSLERGQLVWSGVSKTTNPRRIDHVVSEIAAAVAGDMQRRGLLR